MNRQRDAVGLLTFDDHIRDLLPCSARPGHLKAVLVTLERLTLGSRTDIAKPLSDLAQAIRKRGLVVLISDLLDDPDRIIEGLKHFRYRGTDVVVFQVLDPDELSFPFERAARFRDMESDHEVVAAPAAVRDTYKSRLDAMVSNFRTVLGQNGIDYTLLDTSQPLEVALLRVPPDPAKDALAWAASRFFRRCTCSASSRLPCRSPCTSSAAAPTPWWSSRPSACCRARRWNSSGAGGSARFILLVLRVTALVLLAGAFARPYLAGQRLAADAPLTVIAVDRSFSLSAPGVFDQARALASAAVDEAPANHAVALVAFDEAADTIVAPTTDRGAVRAAIATLSPGVAGTRYATALARAADALGPHPGRVVVVTDLQQAGWQGPPRGGVAEDVEVVVKRVEAPLLNLAVVSAERRGARAEATVRNFGLEARSVPVTLSIDGKEAALTTVSIPAQAAAPVVFDAEVPSRGEASVTVTDDGGVPADDTRYLVLDPAEPTRILVLVADPSALGGGLYVERALGAAGGSHTFDATVVDGRSLSTWTGEQISRQDALVLLGTRSLERRGRELVGGYLARGGSALLVLGPDVDPATLGELLGNLATGIAPAPQPLGGGATLVLGDTRHPVFRPFAMPASALGDVLFERYWPVDDRDRRVLARFSGGPAALLEQSRPQGRLLIFASDLDNKWNRFPLSPAFVPFLVEAGRYLTEIRAATTELDIAGGPGRRRGAPECAAGPGFRPDTRPSRRRERQHRRVQPRSDFSGRVPGRGAACPAGHPAGRSRRGPQG